ncbi:MAG: copper amine oxidase [Clostridiales bacterium]|nr:copper amine oxidase [Clostridiales bacterium]
MKKRLLLSGLVVILLISANPIAEAVDNSSDTPPREISFFIDGQPADQHIPSLLLNSTTYVSIRAFSMAMGAESVTYNNGAAEVLAPDLTVQAAIGSMYLVANGRYLFVPDTCILVNNSIMVPVRILCKAFGASVEWNGAAYSINITKGTGAITPGSDFYDDTDLYWMSRIIKAEAGGESLIGKIAVGGVVMNRIKSPQFPDTVYSVVFDRRYGIQFTPAYSGAIYNRPSEECVIAAKIALDGGNTAGESLYFASTTRCWAGRNRPYAMKIGNHNFYA